MLLSWEDILQGKLADCDTYNYLRTKTKL